MGERSGSLETGHKIAGHIPEVQNSEFLLGSLHGPQCTRGLLGSQRDVDFLV